MNQLQTFACGVLMLSAALPAQLEREPIPLHVAAGKGDVAEVARLLDGGASIDQGTRAYTASQRDGGTTALMIAARTGRLEVVRLLIERGAALDRPDGMRKTAFVVALAAHQDAIVEVLVQAGAKIGPLAYVTVVREPQRLRKLFELGGDANAADGQGRTVLHDHELLVRPEALAVMLDHGASWTICDRAGHSPLWQAASLRLVPALELAKARGAFADAALAANDPARLLAAVVLDDADALAQALAAGAAVDCQDDAKATPLQIAAGLGRASLIGRLVAAGAALAGNPFGDAPPLHLAAGGGHVDTLRELLQAGAPLSYANDAIRGSALGLAAGAGHRGCSEVLLAAGAAIDFANDRGMTPLLEAVAQGHGEVVELLLRAGADRERSGGTFGQRALHLAAMLGHGGIVDALVRADAQVDAVATKPFDDDVTPLMAAVRMGHTEVVRRLLAAGADLSRRSPRGRTALDFAADEAMREVLK